MPSWSLQRRLLLTTLGPVLLLVIGLSSYVLVSRFHDLEELENQQAHLLMAKYRMAFDQLQPITPTALQDLAVAALEEDSVRSLTLLDESGRTLAHSGPLHRPVAGGGPVPLPHGGLQRVAADNSVIFVQQLYRPVPRESGGLTPAWVVLEMSDSSLTIHRYESLLQILGGSAFMLLLAAVLITRQLNRWLQPITLMSESVRKVDASHLDVRLESAAVGDLDMLQHDINTMLDHLATETEELKSSMTQANEDLRETLEVMEVQNIELTLARKEAVEGNRIKSEFLANISHEIRTPLNGIMGFAKLLLKTPMTPRQMDYVHTIQKSSDSLLAIINDVLDLSKIEAGKLVLDQTPLDIEEVVYEVLNMLAPLAEEKNLEQVAFVYDDVPRHLIGDPLRFKQILTNLVNNAIKFTNAGEVTVRAMLEDQTTTHAVIRISVTDTGIGLSETSRADLFRAFSQGDPSTSRKFGGTGLGLVISKHLVEQMGGEINFDSTQDQGSTFWFTIKAVLDQHTMTPAFTDPMEERRILVAESHPTTRQMLVGVLESWGATVQAADSLATLHQILREGNAFDALIVPLTLLEENGRAAVTVSEIQASHSGPLVLLTRSSDSSQEQALYQNRHVTVLSKPIYPRELQSQLHRLWTHVQMPLPGLTPVEHKIRVMAVDDNTANLRLVCALLEDMEVDAVPAGNGAEAIRLAQSQHFDLIFMDIQMPGMSGLEATQKIRENEKGSRRVPIIALTAHAMSNERVALLRSGMDDYVTKPIQETQLAHILAKWTAFKRRGSLAPLPKEASAITTPISGEDSEIVNWSEGLRLAAGKADLARDMLNMLLNSLETEKRKIVAAFVANDMQALLGHVHYLHGATRYCGVPGLRDAAHAVETEIKMLLNLHKSHLAEGLNQDASNTRNCKNSLDLLFQRMEELIVWRDNHEPVAS
jgi:two-component system sensor histidine kinase BarA